ncbi:MAG: RimK family alpha-L-glutamate ligase [Candidatus Woesebacteria bacterium]|jgi:RimK family alpha-L-glutamate ligase
MKVALITTLPSLKENERIEEEVRNLDYSIKLVNLKDFKFEIKKGQVSVPQLTKLKADIVIVRGIFVSIKAISTIVKDLRKKGVKVFDNNFLEHRYSIDKVTDLMKLSLAGIRVPAMFYTRDFSDYETAAKKLGYPLVAKSTRMGKGVGVYKLDNKEQLVQFIDEIKAEGKKAKNYLLQRYIPYKHDLRCLVVGESVFTMKRIPAKGEFRANFSLGGEVKTFKLSQKDEILALSAMKAIDMSVGGVDILIAEDEKRYILEVNHTAGFVGMEEATGKNIAKEYVEHAISSAE